MAIAIRGTTPGTTSGTGDPTSLTLNGSRQPNTGDVLIIIHCNDFYDITNIPTPTVAGSTTGVTAITNGTADDGSSQAHAKSFYYVVGSTGDLTVAVDETGSADEDKALIVYVLSGVDTANPIDVAGNAVNGSVLAQVCPSISPASTDAFLICHVGSGPYNTGSYTPPGSMTEQYDFVVGGAALGATGGTQQLSASGATGTRTFTSTNLARSGTLSIAVKTAASAARHNACVNPAASVNVTGWGGDTTPTRVTGLQALAPAFARDSGFRYSGGTYLQSAVGAAAPGDEITISFDTYAESFDDLSTELYVFATRSAGGDVQVGATDTSHGLHFQTVDRWSVTRTMPALTTGVFFGIGSVNLTVNPTVISGVLIEIAPTADTYFDGDTPGATWDGTTGLSASTLITATDTPGTTSPVLPPHLLYFLVARNQERWLGAASAQASTGGATASARTSTTSSGVKGAAGAALPTARTSTTDAGVKKATGAGGPTARTSTTDAGVKQATGAGLPSARTSSTDAGIKKATGTGLPSARTATGAASGAPAPTGAGIASARTSTTSSGVRGAAGAGSASARSTTTDAGVKKATGAGLPTARTTATQAGLKRGAGPGLPSARSSTVDAGVKKATGTGRPSARTATASSGGAPVSNPSWSYTLEQSTTGWTEAPDITWTIEQASPVWRISQA